VSDAIVIVRTDRLIVRRFLERDLEPFFAYRNDPEVARYQGWEPPVTHDEVTALVAEFVSAPVFEPGQWTQLAIERVVTPGLIGDIGVRLEQVELTAELGFTIARDHWGNGYGREALDAVAELLLDDIELDRVVAVTHRDNLASIKSLHHAKLVPVAVDGDEIVYYRRRGEDLRHRSPRAPDRGPVRGPGRTPDDGGVEPSDRS
jgi:RimJ/RimL family protein N-acetyltransferase